MVIRMDEREKAAIYRFHAAFCKCLGDASRLMLITQLEDGEVSVGELSQQLGLPQASVSKHLAILREHGLVAARRQGATIFYSLSDPRICQAISILKQVQVDLLDRRHEMALRGAGL